jgi:hypothetical protein
MASRKSKTAAKAEPEWERTPEEVDAVEKIATERFRVPRLKVSKSVSGPSFTTEHIDDFVGSALLMQALGTTDLDFYANLLAQLAAASGGEPSEHQLNFMLAVIKGIKPRDQMEACPSADDLGLIRRFEKGGSGSSGLEFKRPAADAASGGLRWLYA